MRQVLVGPISNGAQLRVRVEFTHGANLLLKFLVKRALVLFRHAPELQGVKPLPLRVVEGNGRAANLAMTLGPLVAFPEPRRSGCVLHRQHDAVEARNDECDPVRGRQVQGLRPSHRRFEPRSVLLPDFAHALWQSVQVARRRGHRARRLQQLRGVCRRHCGHECGRGFSRGQRPVTIHQAEAQLQGRDGLPAVSATAPIGRALDMNLTRQRRVLAERLQRPPSEAFVPNDDARNVNVQSGEVRNMHSPLDGQHVLAQRPLELGLGDGRFGGPNCQSRLDQGQEGLHFGACGQVELVRSAHRLPSVGDFQQLRLLTGGSHFTGFKCSNILAKSAMADLDSIRINCRASGNRPRDARRRPGPS
jgi:hypothetical protein